MAPVLSLTVLLSFLAIIGATTVRIPQSFTAFPGYLKAPYDLRNPLRAATLNVYATEYTSLAGRKANMVEFLINFLPARVFDDYFLGCENDFEDFRFNTATSLLHMAGYYGGLWLRYALGASSRFNQDAPQFRSYVLGNFTANLAAVNSNANTYCINKLQAVCGNFGYNIGYYNTIFSAPPAGATPPPALAQNVNLAQASARSTDFTTVVLKAIESGDDWQYVYNNNPAYAQSRGFCAAVQGGASGFGAFTWSGNPLSVSAMLEANYQFLLNSSNTNNQISSFIENRITRASITSKNSLRAGRSEILNSFFGGFYSVALGDTRYDSTSPFPFPTFFKALKRSEDETVGSF